MQLASLTERHLQPQGCAWEWKQNRWLKPDGKLRSKQMIIVSWAGSFVLKIILQFQLGVLGEAISYGDVDPTEVFTPANVMAVAIIDGPEELLIPAKCAEELRRKFVFGFDIIRKCICVAHTRYFKARFIELRPHLEMMPSEAGILSKNKFSIIVDIPPGRQ